jgi:uncharacterized protein YjiS (DUF1127 family)
MILSHAVRAVRAWQRYRACVRELSKLSDLELTDIGISRSGILAVAWRTAQDYKTRGKSADGAAARRDQSSKAWPDE